jgi:hypothetical protein
MSNAIAKLLFQKNVCYLPGIGQLKLVSHPSQTDFLNSCIEAPHQEICFLADNSVSVVSDDLKVESQRILADLVNDGESVLEGIGVFYQSNDEGIQFASVVLDDSFREPVSAIRVIRKDARHTVLVGDKELTNHDIAASKIKSIQKFSGAWWVWALGIAAISIIILGYFIVQFPNNILGNLIRVF